MIQHALMSPSASLLEHLDGARPDVGADGAGLAGPTARSTNARSSAEVTARWPGRPGPM